MSALNKLVGPGVGDSLPDSERTVIFFVSAASEPGIVPRLVEPFSKLGLVPARVHISSENGRGEELSADLRVAGVDQNTAHLIGKDLRRIVGVRSVISLAE